MANVKISELPSGTPTLSGVIPYTNAAADTTYQSTFLNVVSLASVDNLSDVNTSGVSQGNGLVYDSGVWVPQSIVISDTSLVAGSDIITNVVAISSSGYDAIGSGNYSDTTLYVITD